ncbi:hypothetical protein LJR045_002393 [Microbacterium sp. LjRoot45]|uniref:hypothetical protein n=1 Tax=Microbacterium sp. LjRoot45 TaxID=3342329 RepID=UPI003ECFAC90
MTIDWTFPFWEAMATVATTAIAVLLAFIAVSAARKDAQRARRRTIVDAITSLMPELIAGDIGQYQSDPRWQAAKLLAITEPKGAEFFEFAFCGVEAARGLAHESEREKFGVPPRRIAREGVTQYIARAGAVWVEEPGKFVKEFAKDIVRLRQHSMDRQEIEIKYTELNLDEIYGGPGEAPKYPEDDD